MKIYRAYKYNGSFEELQKEIVEIRKEASRDIARNLKPAFSAIIGVKDSLPCGPNVIDDSLKLMSTFWDVQNLKEGRPNGEGVVYFEDGELYVQFFGVSNALIDSILSKKFEDFQYQDDFTPITKNEKGEALSEADIDAQYIQAFKCSKAEYEKRRDTWDKIFRDEGVPVYRGLTFSILHQHIFDNTLITIHQEILKEKDPQKFKRQQAEKREKVQRILTDQLLRGYEVRLEDIAKYFEYNGVIVEEENETEKILELAKSEAVRIKEDFEKKKQSETLQNEENQ